MLKKKFLVILTGLLFLSLTSSKVLAGGWPISTWGWDNQESWRPDYKLTYVRVHLAPDVPCKGTTVTFKYENPQPGDNVSAGGENGSYTFIENGYKVSKFNGVTIPDCNTYAKFYSTNNALKYGIAEFKTAEGKVYSAKFALNFQSPTPSNTDSNEKYPLPWEESYSKEKISLPTPSLEIVNPAVSIKQATKSRTVEFKIENTGKADAWQLFVKSSGDQEWIQNSGNSLGNSAIYAYLSSDKDYQIKVRVVKVGTSFLSEFSNIVNIEKIKNDSVSIKPTAKPKVSLQPTVSMKLSPSTSPQVSTNSADLQQKINELQKKLEESQKRQSVLENRLNQVLSWIKSVFPFFK